MGIDPTSGRISLFGDPVVVELLGTVPAEGSFSGGRLLVGPAAPAGEPPADPVPVAAGCALHPRWVPSAALPLGVVMVTDRREGEVIASLDRLVVDAVGDLQASAEHVDVWGSVSLWVADELEAYVRPDPVGFARALIVAAVLRLAEQAHHQ